MKLSRSTRFVIFFTITIMVMALLNSGCTTAKKATRYMQEHPEVAAEVCAEMFPVRTITDSSEYKESLSVIDSLQRAFKMQDSLSAASRDNLISEIDRLKNVAPADCDSLSEAIYRYAAHEKSRADELQKENNKLAAAARNLKPIRDTVENTAKVTALTNQLNDAIDEGLSLSRDRDHYKEKYEQLDKADKGKLVIRIPWWIVIVVCLGVGAVTVMKLKGIALNPLRWFG